MRRYAQSTHPAAQDIASEAVDGLLAEGGRITLARASRLAAAYVRKEWERYNKDMGLELEYGVEDRNRYSMLDYHITVRPNQEQYCDAMKMLRMLAGADQKTKDRIMLAADLVDPIEASAFAKMSPIAYIKQLNEARTAVQGLLNLSLPSSESGGGG